MLKPQKRRTANFDINNEFCIKKKHSFNNAISNQLSY